MSQEIPKDTTQFDMDYDSDDYHYIKGWRQYILTLRLVHHSRLREQRVTESTYSVALCMFLVNIKVSVVGTSLVSIGDELHGFQQTGWVVTGYLVTYTSKSPHPTNRPLLKAYRIPTPGMIILWAKLSDILGRKPITTATVTIFVVFSGGCAAAQSMTQLIICRVFQGIGAAGCSSLALIVAYEMVPKEYVPAGLVTVVLLLITLPANFPHQGNPDYEAPSWGQRLSRPSLARLDITGAFLLLGATMLLVAVLLEDGVSNGWSSAAAIVTLTISEILWLAFVANEWFLTSDKYRTEPIFPWRFVQDRALMGTFIISLLSGIPYTILVMAIPQHFQTVAGLSPLAAGVRLLPFNLLISSAAVLINVVAGTTGVAPVYLILTGSVVQLVGISLLCTLPTDGNSAIVPAAMYGYQMLAGCGIGCVFGILLQLPPRLVEKRDLAISSGALLQFRVFGGALGLSIATSAMNNYLTSHLPAVAEISSGAGGGASAAHALLQSVGSVGELPPNVREQVLRVLAEGFNLQMKIVAGFSGLQVLMVGMLWRKNQIRVADKKEKKEKKKWEQQPQE
ncbi:putative transporter C3H1.06c [Diplodia seriata]|uniref:Putative transporter C3H1.06c n=1 Tax=Diplodia seriata TaxID=420778 RepID=A0A1S8BKY4_9PEZI|nr:putative transporter C3H1.06c [Diplodia seriata]